MSFRLGGSDGVSIEAEKWITAFRELDHDVTTLAGEGNPDILLSELAIGATKAPEPRDIHRVIDSADLVVVENFVSLPLNRPARDVLYEALGGHRALFRHHDLPWQRESWVPDDTPRSEELWFHVTINDLSRRELEIRGIPSVTIRNSFDCNPDLGRRDIARRSIGVTNERVALLATRAIPRKNVAAALDFAASIDGVLWLLGPSEDGYESTLMSLLASSTVEVRRGLPDGLTIHDAYAACDAVVMPSTWEGFGNPVLESVTHRRPLAAYPYPVLEEIRSFGFQFFGLHETDAVLGIIENPLDGFFDDNLAVAREHFNVTSLPQQLSDLLGLVGLS
jgi:glycosyltransferase involved in cell wall biosynthesis